MIKKLEKRLENEPSTENPAKRQKISKPILDNVAVSLIWFCIAIVQLGVVIMNVWRISKKEFR
jgi:hypothetical protein